MGHMKLPFEGGRNGRYQRSGRLIKHGQRPSKGAIGELTWGNYTLQCLVTKSREGQKRYREENRNLRSFIDNSGE